jgi:multidrug efflux system outer membrane protein
MANRLSALLGAVQAVFLVVLLAGCAATSLPRPEPLPATPAAFRGGIGGTGLASEPQDGRWWQVFGDPVLDQLVGRAMARNTSIDLATAQLSRARALARAADSGRLPRLDLRASASRQGGPLVNAAGDEGNLFMGALALGWEIDLLGRLDHARRAASLDVQTRQALLREAHLLVQIDLVRSYLAVRALDSEHGLAQALAADMRALVAIAERRFANGQLSALAASGARQEAVAAEAELPDLDRRRDTLEHAIAVLVGEPATDFRLAPAPLQLALPDIPSGVPGSVLVRRPDVAAALDGMLAARERIGLAASAGAPDLSVSASGGLAASSLGQLLGMSARTWGFGALASLPLFDGGRREAGVQVAGADFDTAQAQYRARYLGALQDVEDQLAAVRALAAQATVAGQAVSATRQSREITDSRMRLGLVSQLEQLSARSADLRQQRQLLQVRSAQFQATVALVRALGGGWE